MSSNSFFLKIARAQYNYKKLAFSGIFLTLNMGIFLAVCNQSDHTYLFSAKSSDVQNITHTDFSSEISITPYYYNNRSASENVESLLADQTMMLALNMVGLLNHEELAKTAAESFDPKIM